MVKQYHVKLVKLGGVLVAEWLLPEYCGGRPAPVAQTLPPVIKALNAKAVNRETFSIELIIVCEEEHARNAKEQLDADLKMPELAELEEQKEAEERRLSLREQEVLYYWLSGLNRPETAERMHISPQTVKTHRDNIRLKTGMNSPQSLVDYARRHHLPLDERHNRLSA